MKKIPSILFGVLALSALAGCNTTPPHTHTYVEHAEVPATCVVDGLEKYYTCECGKVFDKDKNEIASEDEVTIIEAQGHTPLLTQWESDGTQHWRKCSVCSAKVNAANHVWEEKSNSATCTAEGQITSECEVCHKTKTEPSDALSHEWGTGVVTKAATCTEEGIKTYTCQRDGCNETKTEPISKVSHDYDRTVTVGHKDPTCDEDGYNEYKCKNCTATTKDTLPATGHKAKAAWSTSDTEHWHECEHTGCSEKLDIAAHTPDETWTTSATHHWKECTAKCGVELDKVEHTVTQWTTVKEATKLEEGSEKGNCDVCGAEVTRKINKIVPTSNEIIERIEALGTEPKVMLIDAIKEIYSDIDLMSAEEQGNVINIDQLDALKAATDELAVDIIGPNSKDVETKNYNGNKVSTVYDDTFGKVFSIDGKEDTAWDTIQVSTSEINDEELDDVGLLAFYVNCDEIKTINAQQELIDSNLKISFIEDFSKGGEGISEETNPDCSFYDRITKDHHDILELGMYNDLFGNPGDDWHLVVLNAERTQKVLNCIKENKSFAFAFKRNVVKKNGGTVKFTSLFGFKDLKFEENTFVYRHFSNSYCSQLPSWAAGDTINAKNNKALNVGFNFYSTDYKNIGATYTYKSGHEETVNDYFTYETAGAYDGNFDLLSSYFYVYTNMDTKCQVHFGGGSGPYYNLSFIKGINKITIPADKIVMLDDTNKNITFNFKDPSGNSTWAPGMIFENVGSIYGVYDVITPEMVDSSIDALPENPKAMDMNLVNKAKSDFEKLSVEDKALVEGTDKLEAALAASENYVSLITPYVEGSKFETYNGDVQIKGNVSDSVFGEVFTVGLSNDGKWKTFRLSNNNLDSELLDEIGILGIFLKPTGTGHSYINMDAKIWNSGQTPITVPGGTNSNQKDAARWANKNNSYDTASIVSYPAYSNTFGNPGNGWELCTLSAQYTRVVMNELKTNGEVTFSPTTQLADNPGEYYVAGLFGIKTNGALPTEEIKAAYCFTNAYGYIPEGTALTVQNHSQVDPTFNRNIWPTGVAGDANGVRLDNTYRTFTNNNASDMEPLAGSVIFDNGGTVDSSKSWSALYIYIYVKYDTKVKINVLGSYNDQYVTLKAGFNIVKLADADIATLKAKEGTGEGGGTFTMSLIFQEDEMIPSGQIIYASGIFGTVAQD